MTVTYAWSPDSKHFLTAILFPRRHTQTLNHGYSTVATILYYGCGAHSISHSTAHSPSPQATALTPPLTPPPSGFRLPCTSSPPPPPHPPPPSTVRLRVDNGYRVWSCNGVLLQEEKLDELSLAAWRPLPCLAFAAPDETAFAKRAAGGGGAANKTTATAAKCA